MREKRGAQLAIRAKPLQGAVGLLKVWSKSLGRRKSVYWYHRNRLLMTQVLSLYNQHPSASWVSSTVPR